VEAAKCAAAMVATVETVEDNRWAVAARATLAGQAATRRSTEVGDTKAIMASNGPEAEVLHNTPNNGVATPTKATGTRVLRPAVATEEEVEHHQGDGRCSRARVVVRCKVVRCKVVRHIRQLRCLHRNIRCSKEGRCSREGRCREECSKVDGLRNTNNQALQIKLHLCSLPRPLNKVTTSMAVKPCNE